MVACKCWCVYFISNRFSVGKVDELIVSKLWMEGNIYEIIVVVGSDLWHFGDRLWVKCFVTNDLEVFGLFSDKYVIVGKECEGLWM